MFLVSISNGSSHEMCIRPRPDRTTVPLSLAPALCLCCLQQAAAGICKAVVDVNFYSVNKSHTEWGGFVGGKWQGKRRCKRACGDLERREAQGSHRGTCTALVSHSHGVTQPGVMAVLSHGLMSHGLMSHSCGGTQPWCHAPPSYLIQPH